MPRRPGRDAYQADDRYRVALPTGDYEPTLLSTTATCRRRARTVPPRASAAAGSLTIAAVLGLAVIGTAGAFGYRAFTSGSGTLGHAAGHQGRYDAGQDRPPAPRRRAMRSQQAVPGSRRRR